MGGFITENGTFFDGVWTEELDEHFLKDLEAHTLKVGRHLEADDDEIFDSILTNMYWYTDHIFGVEAIQRRFKLAKVRFHTWKGIMEHEEVCYDHATMTAKATNWTWIELCESYELASAYHKVSLERMWHELNAIFGPDEARDPTTIAARPEKPPRAFELIRPNGKRLPTIDEIITDYLDEEKREWEKKQRRAREKQGIIDMYDPADCMSSTKHPGTELALAKEVIVISPPLNATRASGSGTSGCCKAKRYLPF